MGNFLLQLGFWSFFLCLNFIYYKFQLIFSDLDTFHNTTCTSLVRSSIPDAIPLFKLIQDYWVHWHCIGRNFYVYSSLSCIANKNYGCSFYMSYDYTPDFSQWRPHILDRVWSLLEARLDSLRSHPPSFSRSWPSCSSQVNDFPYHNLNKTFSHICTQQFFC